MALFAYVENGVVTNVVAIDLSKIDTGLFGIPNNFIETTIDGSLRKNYAQIGFSYDIPNDAFMPPKPYASWVLNTTTFKWDAPIPKPENDPYYVWDESIKNWRAPKSAEEEQQALIALANEVLNAS